MSNHGPRYRRVAERRAALVTSRAQGCNCHPDITRGRVDDDGIQHMSVAHDATCPLADGRPGWLTAFFYGEGCRR